VTNLRAPLLGLSLTMLLSAGCAVGPNDKRPSADVPSMYRGAAPQEGAQPAAAQSFGDQKW
jgi:outer membrane protein TolC